MENPIYFNKSAEGAIIGSMVIDTTCVTEILEIIEADDFYFPEAKAIFDTIKKLWVSSKPIDPVLIRDELVRIGEMTDDILNFLVASIQTLPSAANAVYYAEIVRKKSAERQLIIYAHKANKTAQDMGLEYSERVESLKEIVSSLPIKKTNQDLKSVIDIGHKQMATNKQGIKSSFYKLDKLTGGFRAGDIIIVAGRPAMGKSCLMQTMFIEMSKKGMTPCFYSLEMSPMQIAERILCYVGGVSRDDMDIESAGIAKKFIVDENWQGYIPTDIFTISQIEISVMAMKQRGVNIAYIDYLQCIVGQSKHNLYQQTTEVSRRLKELALLAEIPIIVGCQLNRACEKREDHRPRLSDLRDSGSIEQDADMILFLHRDDYYRKNRDMEDMDGKATCHLAKNRQGGTGIVDMIFIPEQYKFAQMIECG